MDAFEGGGSLELVSLSTPPHLQLGHGSRLRCNYDLHNTSLYSLKWYKDGEEFYRFMPSMDPMIEVFAVPGVSIDVRAHDAMKVFNYFYDHSS